MWTLMDSPVGPLRIIEDRGAITAIEFAGGLPETPRARSSMAVAEARSADRPVGDRDDEQELLVEAVRQLRAYFARDLEEFDLPLAPAGTDFQQRVWAELRRIGYGETATYGEIAKRLGMSNAASRAVGLANGRNPIPVVVPCHRVVGANGTLTGYAGGVDRKQTLLDLESDASASLF
jgi:methylated-DNA-[protein]-cysteine S-methyltransferase